MSRIRSAVLNCILLAFLLAGASPAHSQVAWNIGFNDPGQQYTAYYQPIQADALAAGNAWSQYLQGSGTVNLLINFDPTLPTAEAASASTVYVGYDAASSVNVYEQGAAYKAFTGQSAQSGFYDGSITLGTDYLTNDLWFDPQPMARTIPVPSNKVDAVSVFEHEIGHTLAFNGFRNPNTGTLSTPYESTFDANVITQNGGLFFVGSNAESVYGGPVPLQQGDYGHLDGAALPQDLMNGSSLTWGQRYSISPLDVAIAADSSVAVHIHGGTGPSASPPSAPGGRVAVPEPRSVLMLLLGLPLLAVPARRRLRRH